MPVTAAAIVPAAGEDASTQAATDAAMGIEESDPGATQGLVAATTAPAAAVVPAGKNHTLS